MNRTRHNLFSLLLPISNSPFIFIATVFTFIPSAHAQQQQGEPYNLPAVELKERVIWGSVCEPGEGLGLSFGGEDQEADDGCSHTRVLREGKWVEIRSELEQANPFHEIVVPLLGLDFSCAKTAAQMRSEFFSDEQAAQQRRVGFLLLEEGEARIAKIIEQETPNSYIDVQGKLAIMYLQDAGWPVQKLRDKASELEPAERFAAIHTLRKRIQDAIAALDCEPPARALSPLCYVPQSKVYVLFGGDHLDYLTNDTWIFDPAIPQWRQLHPEQAPPPRANHKLAVDKEGKITLTGGYTYTSTTDYVGGQYRDLNDGTWTYDLATNKWSGSGEMVKPTERTYRTGPFSQDFFWQGDRPDKSAFQAKLAKLPANTWTKLEIPYLPEMNRDWGTAILDPTHDLILRFSGGHSAHGGSDVLHFHLATGRWELPNPVEFPLGQLYSNTSYPAGFNLNVRPWVTGHTYKSYAYDQLTQQMLFVGEQKYTYLYSPVIGDWTRQRIEKPKAMQYEGCYYTLTLCPTRHVTFCWTNDGQFFRWDKVESDWGNLGQWKEITLQGEKLPGTVVDRSGFVYDSRRQRFLCTTKPYEGPFDGQVYAIDVNSKEVTKLKVPNSAAMSEVGFLREGVYVPELDAVLLGVNFPLDEGKPRRTPIFDCKSNRWMVVELGGEDPSGREGVNVSLGMIYDAARKLVWAVDTHSNVYALRLDGKSLEMKQIDAK
jgi:hypothetical protein